MPVITRDEKRIGRVSRLVIDPDTQELLEIVVQQRLPVPVSRIVNWVDVDRVKDGALILKIDADVARELPHYAAHEYTVAVPANGGAPFPLGAGPTTNLPVLYRKGGARREMHPARTNLFQEAVLEGAVVEVRSNLPDSAVVLERGTDVVDVEGRKIGTVHEMIVGPEGDIDGVTIRSGRLTHIDVTVPIEMVEAFTHRYVRLNIPAEFVEDEAGMSLGTL